MLYLVIAIAVVALLVVLAISLPTRITSRTSTHGHDGVVDDATAQRNHPPGGNTGSI